MNPLVVPVTSVKFKSAFRMCNKQWIFYENFLVFGQIENLGIDLVSKKTFTSNSGKLSWQKFRNCFQCEFTAHYACKNAVMNLKSTTTNGFNFWIINSLMDLGEYPWAGLTVNLIFWDYIILSLLSVYANWIFNNYWMRLSRIWRILPIEEGATPSGSAEFFTSYKSQNSIIILLFLQNNSKFKNKLKHANLRRIKFISIIHLYREV